jgi:tetratricopeptide (TPR) repeat protein
MSKALKIEEDLAVTDLDLVRDERALGYTEDLESYMKKIRATDYALILVSDAFLRSTNCMFEIHEFLKDDSHQQRVLPVILKDYEDGGVKRKGARIYAPEDAAEYVRYWQDREALLRKHLKGLDISNLTHFARELALIQSVTKTVADFIFLLRKIKHVSFADLVTSEYRDILEKVGYGDVGTAQVRKARSLYSQAIAEVNLERRLEFLTKALQTYPSYVDALNKRGQVYDELRQYDKALIDYNRAVNIAPGRAALFISRSYTFIRQADYFNALADLEMALSLDPNHKEAFNNRADVHRRLGKLGEAVQDARRSLAIDPDFDLAHATLAEVAATEGQAEEFFTHLTRAVDLGFPLHKYSFDSVYEQFTNDDRFGKLLELSRERNQRFI